MLRLIIQVLSFLILCSASGYIFSRNSLNFYIGAAAGAAIQFVFNYIYNSILDTIIAFNNKKLENERIREYSFQGIEVECPCSKQLKDFVPIRLNTPNKYKCKECKKLISVFITPSTALSTEPILDTNTTNPSIFLNGSE
jgi:hypothetical protein